MNYYNEIKNKLIDNEIYSKVKDYSKERNRVLTYYEVGRMLSEAGSKYGEDIIGEYSNRLVLEVGRKYTRSVLFRMKQFYNIFSNEKVAPLVRHLNWSHCLILLPIKDIDRMIYYINQTIDRNLSKRELQEIIKNKEYERLPKEAKNKLIQKEKTNVVDLIPNPILIKNSNNYEIINEKALQQLILEDIPHFLKELGSGFTFIENEYKVKIGNSYNYIDILLFNIELNCYVVIELKVTELKKEHIGQIEVYMNAIDDLKRTLNQNKTIGIIICKHNNEYIIGYSSDERIISREYELI